MSDFSKEQIDRVLVMLQRESKPNKTKPVMIVNGKYYGPEEMVPEEELTRHV